MATPVSGAGKAIGQYWGGDIGGHIGEGIGKTVEIVALPLIKAPSPAKKGMLAGAACGAPLGPVGAMMGAGFGGVIGLVYHAATGGFD